MRTVATSLPGLFGFGALATFFRASKSGQRQSRSTLKHSQSKDPACRDEQDLRPKNDRPGGRMSLESDEAVGITPELALTLRLRLLCTLLTGQPNLATAPQQSIATRLEYLAAAYRDAVQSSGNESLRHFVDACSRSSACCLVRVVMLFSII